MTETAAADPNVVIEGPDVSGRDITEGKTLATIRPEQRTWDADQLALLRQLGIEDATQADVDLFFHVCRTSGLDPFRKQIYMIGRNTKLTEWIDDDRVQGGRRKQERWVTKYTIQTGIDGYRRNGREAANRLGDALAFDGPYWCGDDGQWREVWPASTPPTAAKFTVFRNGEPFSAVVHYDEFVQSNPVYEGSGQNRKKVGDEPNSMWAKMPRNQTAKCAEAMAWRRAYPDDFSALIMEDAAQPMVIDETGQVVEPQRREPRRPGGVSGLRDMANQAAAAGTPGDADTDAGRGEPEPAAPGDRRQPAPMSDDSRRKWINRMFQLFGQAGIGEDQHRDDQITVQASILKRSDNPPEHRDELTDDELRTVVDQLNRWNKAGTLANKVGDIIDLAAIEKAQQDTAAPADAGDDQGTLV